MRVVSMALLEVFSWFLYLLLILLIFLSGHILFFGYLVPVILLYQYALLIWMIPLNLNWSKGLYTRLLGKVALLFSLTILSFSVIYHFYGIVDTASGKITKDFLTCLYFSVTTWTTLGYGDFRPVLEMRLFTSFEAITGILSMPLVFTMIWKYCDFRIWRRSEEDEQQERKDFKLRLDERGVWKQLSEDDQIIEIAQQYSLNPCRKCGNSNLKVERYFEITGLVSPRMQFMVHCTCGQVVYKKYMAMTAVRVWNRKNKIGS